MNPIIVRSVADYVRVVCDFQKGGLDDGWYRGIGSLNYDLIPGLYWRERAPELESTLCHRFLVSYKAYGDYSKLNAWEKYALMQHHGLPTRLLDWTENPLVALYFALKQSAKIEENCAVWVINPYALNSLNYNSEREVFCPSEMSVRKTEINGQNHDLDTFLPPVLCPYYPNNLPPYPVAIQSSYGTSRIKAQMGCFTIHGEESLPIDHYYRDSKEAVQVIIDAEGRPNYRKELLRDLACLGVNQETIFQDLDHLSKRILLDFKL